MSPELKDALREWWTATNVSAAVMSAVVAGTIDQPDLACMAAADQQHEADARLMAAIDPEEIDL